MKKRNFLAFALGALLMSVPFVSCGDDDDDIPGGSNAPEEVPGDSNEGSEGGSNVPGNKLQKLTSIKAYGVTMYSFVYDSAGRLTKMKPGEAFEGDVYEVRVSYEPMKIELCMTEDDNLTFTNISTNSKGYVTSCLVVDPDYDNETIKESFSYDSAGHLTKISFSDGGSTDLSWSDGKLKSVTDDDGMEYKYTYSNLANKTGAVSPMWEPLSYLWFTGLFGAAPSYFPSGITITDNYDGETDEYELAYKLNSNGTISAEQLTVDGATVTLSYSYANSKAVAETGDVSSVKKIKLPSIKSIFKRHGK